jgi:hypothetical protein
MTCTKVVEKICQSGGKREGRGGMKSKQKYREQSKGKKREAKESRREESRKERERKKEDME